MDDGLVSVDAGGVYAPADWETLGSPETYVGYARAEGFASPGGLVTDRSHVYVAPRELDLNQWSLSGDWTVGGQPTELNESGGQIQHRFHARDVNLVMGAQAGAGSVRFRMRIDGGPPGSASGLDVDEEGNGTVAEERLYQLVRQPGSDSDRIFEITFLHSGRSGIRVHLRVVGRGARFPTIRRWRSTMGKGRGHEDRNRWGGEDWG